jgi:hypothetical protein
MLLYRKISFFSGFRPPGSVRVRPDIQQLGLPMYRIPDTVRSTHGQDGAVVLDIRQGQMFNINLVGSRILELLKQGFTESAIVVEIGREFHVSRETAEKDVREFIDALKKHELLQDPGTNGQH